MVPDAGTANEPRREGFKEGGAVEVGVGMADMVNACLVNTDMVNTSAVGGVVWWY
jgi:hypothetical protein